MNEITGSMATPSGNFSLLDVGIRERNMRVIRAISYLDVCSIAINVVAMTALLFIIYYGTAKRKEKLKPPTNQNKNNESNMERLLTPNKYHSFRTIMLLILAFLWSLSVGEALIRYVFSSVTLSTLIIVSPVLSFMTTLSAIAFYNFIESSGTSASSFVFIPIVLWMWHMSFVSANLYKVIYILSVGAVCVSPSLNVSILLVLNSLVIYDVITCIKEIYSKCKRKFKGTNAEADKDSQPLKFISKSCLKSFEKSPDFVNNFGENYPKLIHHLQDPTVTFVPSPSGTLERDPEATPEGTVEGYRLRYTHNESSFISRASFWWYLKILRQGWKRPLEYSDLDKIPSTESSSFQYDKLRQKYVAAANKSVNGSPSLWYVYFSCYWKSLLLGGILKFLGDVVNIVGPLSIAPVVNFVRNIQEGTLNTEGQFREGEYFVEWNEFIRNGWILAWVALVASLLQSSFSQASSHIMVTEGIHVRSSLQAMVYSKCLRRADLTCCKKENTRKEMELPQTGTTSSSKAVIINLATDDAENILSFFLHCHYIWAIPLKVSALVVILWMQLGISAIYASALAILILIPVQFLLAKCISSVNKKFVVASDDRLLKTQEFVSFIRSIKANVWQNIFITKVIESRGVELNLLLKDSLLRAGMTFLTQASGIVIILLAFGFYAIIHDHSPDEGTVFSSLALFSQLTVPLFILPLIVAYTIKAKRSTVRLEEYLTEQEISSSRKAGSTTDKEKSDSSLGLLELNQPSIEDHHHIAQNVESRNESTISEEEGKIASENFEIARIQKGFFGLRRESHNFMVLEDINLSIPKEKLTIVVGDVGAGKSSLLLALLEEIPQISGTFRWTGGTSVAFVSQTPWLLNCSLKENILFFKGFHRQRYENVLRAVALTPDIQILPDGDDTEIGERGINLSGGQRQRVTIARALYSEAPVILMDCPFSSLDTNVSSHVFQEGILDFLLNKKKTTVVLATQHQHLCQYADYVVYLQNKTIHCQGTPSEVFHQYPHLWNQKKSQTVPLGPSSNLSVPNIWKERNSLKRHVSRMNIQYSTSRKSLYGHNFEEDINEMFLRTLPLRNKHSFARSSPLHAVLPSDEIEGLHTRTLTRKKRLRPTKPPIFRTTSSTPAFGRTEEDLPLRETFLFDRHSSKSLSSIPKRNKSLPSAQSRDNARVKRESSVFRNFFRPKSLKITESQKKLKRRSTRSRWSIKRFLSMEEENKELDDSGFENNEDGGSEDEFYEALIDEEERERGRISKKNYLAYIQACGWGIGVLYLMSSLVNQGASVALDVWLGIWSTDNTARNMNLTDVDCSKIFNHEILEVNENLAANKTVQCQENFTVQRYLFIFTLLSGLAVMVGFLTICLAQITAHRGRRLLFQKLFSSVIGSRLKFFDVTPIGRILNRFSSDTSMIDKELGWSIMHLVFFALLCGSAILVNTFISPIFVIATIPICLIYYFIQHVFRCTSRELKRLESLSRSPILGLISETAVSPTVIRAYGAEEKFFASYFKRLDTNLGSSILLHSGNRWLGISLDYMGSIIVFLSMIACLMGSTVNVGNFLTPATVGLAIKYTLTIPVYLNWLVRFLSDTEMCLNSVERVRQYSSLTPEPSAAESDSNFETKRMPSPVKKGRCKIWQSKNQSRIHEKTSTDMFPSLSSQEGGRIEFQSVNLYYERTCEPVVSNLSFVISSGQKVGICGRTGSGKSSVLQGILGMVDFHEGNIILNGIDSDDIPLDKLRNGLSVVLQEDCLFQGNVRFQMDPENKHQDEALWDALDLVFLKDFVSSLPNKLYTEIGSGSFTLSSGQIQLLTLSRVILAKKPFVLLDEVTSSLDLQMERNIFDMLRRELPHSTILHVTHSVPCLLESDRILVFHKGELIEDGPPQELLKDKRGRFSSLLKYLNKYP